MGKCPRLWMSLSSSHNEGGGTSIVVVTHTNKNDEDKRPGGSIAFAASADVILHLAVEGDNRRRVLSGVKNRFDERFLFPATVLGLNQETGHIESLGPKSEAVYRNMAEDVLTALESGPLMQSELFKAVTGKTGDKSKTVIRLHEVGKIQRTREGKGFKCSLKETSSSPSLLFPRGGEELNNAALPLPPLMEGGRGRADEAEKMSILDERERMTSEERADEVYNDGFVWAAIEEYWPGPGIDVETVSAAELTPPRGSAPYYAMILCDVLTQRAMTPKAQGILDKHRVKMGGEPYDSGRNAESVLAQFELLAEAVSED